MILHIALRELRSLFLSPLAWAILAVIQAIIAWKFFTYIVLFFELQPQLAVMNNAPGVTDLVVAPILEFSSIIILFICPLLTMRLLSEERNTGTLNLLLSSPVSMTEIVLGKYLGIMIFFLLLVLLISLMPLSLLMGTELDIAKISSGILGQILLVGAFAAAGLYMSSLTKVPAIASISTFGLLIMLWIINTASDATNDSGNLFTYLSLTKHYTPMLRGIVNTSDIVYYLLFIFSFIVLSIKQLDAMRLQK